MSSNTWVEIGSLTEQLLCSSKIIYELKKSGVFQPGVHFYTLGDLKGKHVYCVELCRQALLEKTADLAKKKSKNILNKETYNEAHLEELVQLATK